ncbi:MAG: helix-turn-helix domain-containing protein [Chryseolinea sp.]
MILNPFINTASIGCLFFLAILTLTKKSNTPLGYRFLSLLFILLALIFTDDVLEYYSVFNTHPWLIIVFEPLVYAFAPLIYLAVSYLTTIRKELSPMIIFHFIPYVLLVGLYVISVYADDNPGEPDAIDEKTLEAFLLTLFYIQIFFYLYFSITQLKRHRLNLPLFVSNLSDNDYHWLFKTIIGLSALAFLSLIEVIFHQGNLSLYFSFLYLVGFYYVGIQVSKQKDVFPFTKDQMESVADLIHDHQHVTEKEVKVESALTLENNDPHQISMPERKKVISEEKITHYKQQLEVLMELEKPYLDSEITLPKLAELLKLNTYQASYLINSCFNENFFTFVNRYRLDKCKRMLIDPTYNHLSILGIAFECGFNSKTAFNTSFKKYVGLSPKEFKEQIGKVKTTSE